MVGEGDVLAQDVGKRRVTVLALKRRRAIQHLVDQDAQRPPVDGARVPAALNHLGRDVLLRPDERVGAEVGDARLCVDGRQRVRAGPVLADDHGRFAARVRLFGEVEVGKHDVAGLVEQDVWPTLAKEIRSLVVDHPTFWLQIPVDEPHEVQIL